MHPFYLFLQAAIIADATVAAWIGLYFFNLPIKRNDNSCDNDLPMPSPGRDSFLFPNNIEGRMIWILSKDI